MKKDRRMRMLWNSNAVWAPSGYGVHQREILYRFLKDGWTTAQIAFYGLEGAAITINGLKVYPKMGDTWGTDAMFHHGKDFKADVIFSMQDVWPMNADLLRQIPRWIPYVPIDHDPVPPPVVDKLKLAYRIVTFSKFGQKMLAKHGLASKMIPEGTNVDIFKPGDKAKARAELNLPPNIFLFGMIGANKDLPPRKGFQCALDAFAEFVKTNPNSGIFIHTLVQQQGGFPVLEYAKHLGIEKHLYFLRDYQVLMQSDHNLISKEMQAFDVLLQPSLNEGFGLPIIEAQACGVPVIVNDFSAMPDLIIEGKTGLKIPYSHKFWTPIQGYVAHPDPKALYKSMVKIHGMNTKKMGKAARKHIVKNYNVETIVKKQWLPFLEELQLELLGKPVDKVIKK